MKLPGERRSPLPQVDESLPGSFLIPPLVLTFSPGTWGGFVLGG